MNIKIDNPELENKNKIGVYLNIKEIKKCHCFFCLRWEILLSKKIAIWIFFSLLNIDLVVSHGSLAPRDPQHRKLLIFN